MSCQITRQQACFGCVTFTLRVALARWTTRNSLRRRTPNSKTRAERSKFMTLRARDSIAVSAQLDRGQAELHGEHGTYDRHHRARSLVHELCGGQRKDDPDLEWIETSDIHKYN